MIRLRISPMAGHNHDRTAGTNIRYSRTASEKSEVLVPISKLAKWVETQRRQYVFLKQNKPSRLTPERIQLLEDLGFEWDPYEVRWLERYHELIEFQRLNGEAVLPNGKTGKALHRWIVQQQKAYHVWMAGGTSTMNEQRRDRLESRGVIWTMPVSTQKKGPLSRAIQHFRDMTE